MPEIYRVGNHQPQNLYRGDTYIGVMFDPADAALIVQVLNGEAGMAPTEDPFPQEFRDGTGIWWSRNDQGSGYLSPRGGGALTLAEIKEAYGSWDGWTDAS